MQKDVVIEAYLKWFYFVTERHEIKASPRSPDNAFLYVNDVILTYKGIFVHICCNTKYTIFIRKRSFFEKYVSDERKIMKIALAFFPDYNFVIKSDL